MKFTDGQCATASCCVLCNLYCTHTHTVHTHKHPNLNWDLWHTHTLTVHTAGTPLLCGQLSPTQCLFHTHKWAQHTPLSPLLSSPCCPSPPLPSSLKTRPRVTSPRAMAKLLKEAQQLKVVLSANTEHVAHVCVCMCVCVCVCVRVCECVCVCVCVRVIHVSHPLSN